MHQPTRDNAPFIGMFVAARNKGCTASTAEHPGSVAGPDPCCRIALASVGRNASFASCPAVVMCFAIVLRVNRTLDYILWML